MNQYNEQFTADTKQLFSGWAGSYDSSLFRLYFERLYRRILRTLDQHDREYISPGATVLDIACGTGEILIRLATQYPQTTFIGIDLTPAMVELARSKTKLLPNVAIKEGNAEHLTFSDNVFDAVLCSEAFHHFSHPEQALQEIHRVAKERSFLMIVDSGFPSPFITKIIERISRSFEINKHIYNQHELRHLLEQQGFSIRSMSHYFFNNFFVCTKNQRR